jgi:predicted nuclease of predicted toxin-antitoxin system
MPEFLIDANLPAKIKVWESNRFLHALKINPNWADKDIWEYAKENNLTIVSKDKDFLLLQFQNGSPPKIVHIKFGNIKLSDFILIIENCWKEVEILLTHHTIINIYSDKIEAIK